MSRLLLYTKILNKKNTIVERITLVLSIAMAKFRNPKRKFPNNLSDEHMGEYIYVKSNMDKFTYEELQLIFNYAVQNDQIDLLHMFLVQKNYDSEEKKSVFYSMIYQAVQYKSKLFISVLLNYDYLAYVYRVIYEVLDNIDLDLQTKTRLLSGIKINSKTAEIIYKDLLYWSATSEPYLEKIKIILYNCIDNRMPDVYNDLC